MLLFVFVFIVVRYLFTDVRAGFSVVVYDGVFGVGVGVKVGVV